MCFQQPELTACLAELSSTITELASRHYDLPSPRLAWPELQALSSAREQHEPARCDAAQLSWRRAADSRAELQATESACCDAAEAEQAVEGSRLQAIIERQVRALQDVTNVADKHNGGDKDDVDAAAFRGVSFNRHKRASPCAHCGGLFFPKSLRIHQDRCSARPPSSPPAPAAAAGQRKQPVAACAAQDRLARPPPSSTPAPAVGAWQRKQPAPQAACVAEDRCSAKPPSAAFPVPAAATGQQNQSAPGAACAAPGCLARLPPSSPSAPAAGAGQGNQPAPRITCATEEEDDAEQTQCYTCPPPSPADSESSCRLASCTELRHATIDEATESASCLDSTYGGVCPGALSFPRPVVCDVILIAQDDEFHALCTSMVGEDKDYKETTHCDIAYASGESSINALASSTTLSESASTPRHELFPDACVTSLETCSRAETLAQVSVADRGICAAKATQCSLARHDPVHRRRSKSKGKTRSSHGAGLEKHTLAQPVSYRHQTKSEQISLKMRSGSVPALDLPVFAKIPASISRKSSASQTSEQRSVGRSTSVSSQASLAPTTSTSSRRKKKFKQAMNQDAVHHSLSRASCEQDQDEPCEGGEAWLSEELLQHQQSESDDDVQTPQELQSHWAEYAYTEPRQCHLLRRDKDAWLSPAKQAAPVKRLERIPRSWQVLSKVQLQEAGEEQCLQVPPGIVAVAVTKPRLRAGGGGGGAPRVSKQRQHLARTTPIFR